MPHTLLRTLLVLGLLAGLSTRAPAQAPDTGTPQASTGAQAETSSPMSSPLGTVQFFLRKFDDKSGDWRRDVLSTLNAPAAMSEPDRWDAAVRLLGVFNRLAREITELHEPAEADGRARFFPPNGPWFAAAVRAATGVARIELVLENGRWRFSASTVTSARDLYEALAQLPKIRIGADEKDLMSSLWLQSVMPISLRESFLSLEYWQWLGLFLIVLLGIVLDYTVRAILRTITNRTLDRVHAFVSRETVTGAVRPIGLCSAAFLWVALLPLIGLSGMSLIVLRGAVALFAVLAGTWAAWRVVDLIAEAATFKCGARPRPSVDDILIPLVRKSVKIFILIFGVIYAAESMSIEIAPLIASLGIGGLAFAFAAKDTIENFFGSIAVLDRPAVRRSATGSSSATSRASSRNSASARRASARSTTRSMYRCPTRRSSARPSTTTAERKYRRTKVPHRRAVRHDARTSCSRFREGIMELVRTHPYTRKDYYQVWFHQFGPSIASTCCSTSSSRCRTGRPSCVSANGSSSTSCASRSAWASSSPSRPARSTCIRRAKSKLPRTQPSRRPR